jgi:hypothetical protein
MPNGLERNVVDYFRTSCSTLMHASDDLDLIRHGHR